MNVHNCDVMNVHSCDKMNIHSSAKINIHSGDKLSVNSGDKMSVNSGDKMNIDSGDKMIINSASSPSGPLLNLAASRWMAYHIHYSRMAGTTSRPLINNAISSLPNTWMRRAEIDACMKCS